MSNFYDLEIFDAGELSGPSCDVSITRKFVNKNLCKRRPAHYGKKYWSKAVRKSNVKIDNGRARKENFFAAQNEELEVRQNYNSTASSKKKKNPNKKKERLVRVFPDKKEKGKTAKKEEEKISSGEGRIRPVFICREMYVELPKSSLKKYNHDQNRTVTVNPDEFKKI